MEEPRVTIRRARAGDAALLAEWRGLEPIRRYQPITPLPAAELRRRIQKRQRASLEEERGHELIWIAECDGTPAGWVMIRIDDWTQRTAAIGFSVAPWAEGRGIAGRAVSMVLDLAFGPGRMERIEADCTVDNLRSQKLLERLGFQREGRLRSLARIADGRRDFYLYSILRDEWPNPPRPDRAGS